MLSTLGHLWTRAFADAATMLRLAWLPVLVVSLAPLLVDFVMTFVEPHLHTQMSERLIRTLVAVAADWITAPFFVVLFRLVLSGRTDYPSVIRRDQTTERFFAWSAIMTFVSSIPLLLIDTAFPSQALTEQNLEANVPAMLLLMGLMLALIVFIVRTVTLLPATALGHRISIANAFAHTRGRFWLVFLSLLLVALPFFLPMMALPTGTPLLTIPVSLIFGAGQIMVTLAVSARLYQLLAPRSETS